MRVPGLAFRRGIANFVIVWDQPYLETCCRSALHRLCLSGPTGRPSDLPDRSCLLRLAAMGLCNQRTDGRFAISEDGVSRHASDVLRRGTVRTTAR
jgi:hypothetical protein